MATCSRAVSESFICFSICSASTTVMIESMRTNCWSAGIFRKVCATGAGIGDTRGLDEQVIEAALLHQALHTFHEILAHGAAQAAVGKLEHIVGLFHQGAIDADLADLIDDHGELVAVILLEDVVEERGFAGAEKAGEDGDRDRIHGCGQER
ncbi:MAG: hypothetical protein WDN28_09685 [Chthoniobacter sp.]